MFIIHHDTIPTQCYDLLITVNMLTLSTCVLVFGDASGNWHWPQKAEFLHLNRWNLNCWTRNLWMMIITMKMNVIDSTESTDTITFINNEQSIIFNWHCVFSYIFHIFYSDTKTLDYMVMEINCSLFNSFS